MPLLSIDIEARYAKFQDAMTAMERSAKKSANSIQGAFGTLNGTLAKLGVGLSAGALVGIVKNAIDAADHLNDLSKKTGIAVDVLGGLGFAAAQAGGDLESIAAAAGKLNKSIAEAGSGNKEVGVAFEKLGISVQDASGKLKTADKVIAEVADKFQGYEDGPEKAAIALRLFGKAGADVIPLLNDGGEALRKNIEYYQKYSGITQDVAEKSDAFNDTLEKIKLLSGSAGNKIAAELLPTLQILADKMLDAKEKGDGFAKIAKGISVAFNGLVIVGATVGLVFERAGQEIGAFSAILGRLAEKDFKGAANVFDSLKEDHAKSWKDYKEFVLKIANGESSPTDKPKEKQKAKTAPRLPDTSQDPAKKLLEARLRELEHLSDQERELLSVRNEFLQDYYHEDLIAIGEYYAARTAAADEAYRAQAANIDKEVALLRARKGKDANEQADNEGKIKELIAKKADLQQKASLEAIRSTKDQTESMKQLARSIEEVNTQLLEQQGHSGEVAARRFDETNRQLRQRLETELASAQNNDDGPGQAVAQRAINNLNALRSITVAQGKLNELQDQGSRIQSDLTIATERAQLAADSGSKTELQSLREVSNARAQTAVDLQAVADAYAKMAAETGNPALIQRAKEMQVEVEKLAASADLVREKFQGVFESGFESFFEKLASGTASLKDAFKSLFADISAELTKMAAKDFAKQLFGKDGSFGGVVDFASKIFGGEAKTPTAAGDVAGSVAKAAGIGTDAAAAAASTTALTSLAAVTTTADASIVAMSTSTISANAAMITLAASATTAAAGLALVGASSAGDSTSGLLGDVFSFVMAAKGKVFNSGSVVPFAKGGMPDVVNAPTFFPMKGGKTGLMGEAGPEAIMPLVRDPSGKLAIRMLTDRGLMKMLPLTRDQQGRLAVSAANDSHNVQKFAIGGVFGVDPSFSTNAATASLIEPRIASMTPGIATSSGYQEHGQTNNINVNVPQGTSSLSASQIAAETATALARHQRRNR